MPAIRRLCFADATRLDRRAQSRDDPRLLSRCRVPRTPKSHPSPPAISLLLYSDGILEARDRSGQFFDGDRVARWLSDIGQTSAEQFAEAALGELTKWTGGGLDDDVTFVIAERGR